MQVKDVIVVGPAHRTVTIGANDPNGFDQSWNTEVEFVIPSPAIEGILHSLAEYLVAHEEYWSWTDKGIRIKPMNPALRAGFVKYSLKKDKDEWNFIFRSVQNRLQRSQLVIPNLDEAEQERYIAFEVINDLFKDKVVRDEVTQALKTLRSD